MNKILTSLCILCLAATAAVAQKTPIPPYSEGAKTTLKPIDRRALQGTVKPVPSSTRVTSTSSRITGTKAATMDMHTYARPNEAQVTHVDLDLTVDFKKQRIKGAVTCTVNRKHGNTLILDTRGLDISNVTDDKGKALEYELLEGDSLRGQPLSITLDLNSTLVTVNYATTDKSVGLQWLTPEQNDGSTPFLYSQGQAILTRSWIPVQDSPAIRMTYKATINVPEGMTAVMSASGNPNADKPNQTRFEFIMNRPVPAYLIALAVGNLKFEALSGQTGVYALPDVLPEAVSEFRDLPMMLDTAVNFCGPYEWGRFDVLVLPPSFPFGGMENPMLTFATPTILAGDRSLVSLIVHELVHSWSGNLVTNATWNDFWLNEGWTVYLERRIVEKLYGEDVADMMEVLGFQDLEATIAGMPKNRPDTKLYLDLKGRDPDEAMTDVVYERGAMVIKNVEVLWGREKFDPFIKTYFAEHRFKSLTTEGFIRFVTDYAKKHELSVPDLYAMVTATGKPKPGFTMHSDRLIHVEKARVAFLLGKDVLKFGAGKWNAQERQYFLRSLADDALTEAQLSALDSALVLKGSKNSEVTFEWFRLCIRNGHEAIRPQLDAFLGRVGRRKFILPLYRDLFENADWREWGKKRYAQYRNRYHSITSGSVDRLP